MVETRKHIKVFLGSPGDLGEERKTAKAVVDEYNALFASALGYQIELVGWEDTVSVYGRPQATINRELERCQLFIGMMWKHWGTPPDKSGPYTSGFEEEFRQSVARRAREGSPEISMFFKNIDGDFMRDPGPALSKVLAFRTELIDGKAIYFEDFSDATDFEKKLRRCLTTYVFRLQSEEAEEAASQSQSAEFQQAQPPAETSAESPLTLEGAKFLRAFVSDHETGDATSVVPSEVARIRLLTSVIRTVGNDAEPLGVHDLNLLFEDRTRYAYGRREQSQLLSDGLEHYGNETAPVWHWSALRTEPSASDLVAFTLFGRAARRVGAFKALTFLGVTDIGVSGLDRSDCLDAWFRAETPVAVRREALKYLENFGIVADLEKVKVEIERKEPQTQSEAIAASIRIRLRDSRDDAIKALNEYQPSRVAPSILSEIFSSDHAISTKILIESLKHQNAEVRRSAARSLQGRGALSVELAGQLIADNDAWVRLAALRALIAGDHHFTEDQAKLILMPASKASAGLLASPERLNKEAWEAYRLDGLRAMPLKDLEDSTKFLSVYDREPYFILASRDPARFGPRIRASLAQRFKTEFEEEYDKVARMAGVPESLLKQTRGLEGFVRQNLARSALDLLSAQLDRRDLALVREILTSKFVGWTRADMAFFAKFGEWSDVELIIAGCGNWNDSFDSLFDLSAESGKKYEQTAAALYAIGKNRLFELLMLDAPARVRVNLLRLASDTLFRAISDDQLDVLAHDDDDTVRKAAMLKAARSLTKGKLSKFLARYMERDRHRYYNVIHWTDMALSTPRHRIKPAVDRALAQMA